MGIRGGWLQHVVTRQWVWTGIANDRPHTPEHFSWWQIVRSVSVVLFIRPAYNVPTSSYNWLVSAALILRSVAIV
jgi:hypothetical protein